MCGKYAQNVVTQAQWHCVLTGTEKSCVGRKQHLQGEVVFASRQKQSATFLIHVTSQSAKEMTAKLKIQEIIKKYFLIVSDILKSFLESGLDVYQSMTQDGHLTENCVT